MKIKLLIALAVITPLLIVGCNKPSTPGGGDSQSTASSHDTQPPTRPTQATPPILAEPFHGQVYKSLNGETVLTLVSPDECELAGNGKTLLCKYTKQGDKLRIVVTTLGTTQVFYLRFTNQGLEDEKGEVLFSPVGLVAKEKEIELQKAKLEMEMVFSVNETHIISTFSPSAIRDAGEALTGAQLVLTDVSLKSTGAAKNVTVYFSSVEDVYPAGGRNSEGEFVFMLAYSQKAQSSGELGYATFNMVFKTETEASDVRRAVLNAIHAWKAKFPNAGEPGYHELQ